MIYNNLQRIEYSYIFIFINVLSKVFLRLMNYSTLIEVIRIFIVKKIKSVNLTIRFNKCVKTFYIHNK